MRKKPCPICDPAKAAADARAQEYFFRQSRRRFLSNSVSALTGASIALASGSKKSWYAWADSDSQRPYMINIHLPGGWDTNWFHMAQPKSDIGTDNPNFIQNLPSKLSDPNYPPQANPATADPFGRRVDVDQNGAITQFYHGIYTERTLTSNLLQQANQVADPDYGLHYLGAGAQNAFSGVGGLGLFRKRVCVWKGIASGGAHSIPNQSIIHGSLSQYAIPYSGLIAEAMAAKYGKKQLHYLQLTSTPGDYGANWAMVKGDQIPINCADHNSLKKLTQRDPNDFSDPALYGALNDSVGRLGSQIGKTRFSLSSSQQIYNSFMNFFTGALGISALSSKMGPFLQTWCDYAEYARVAAQNLHTSEFLAMVSPDVIEPLKLIAYNYHLYAPFEPNVTLLQAASPLAGQAPQGTFGSYQSDLSTLHDALATPFQATEDSLNIGNPGMAVDAANIRACIASAAWKFAVADFMITHGFTNVVDMVFPTGDMHSDNSSELRRLTIVYSLYAKLLSSLDGASTPYGDKWLDRTLVTVFSEFDRTPGVLTETSMNNRGTGHGSTESILFAGFGVKQGRVIGTGFSGGRYGPTVLKSATNGKPIDYTYPFPTIMKIFGVDVPAQQITGASSIAEILA